MAAIGWVVRTLATIGIVAGLSILAVLAYMHFTDESSWIETPRIEDGRLYLHVAHKDGRIFKPSSFANITLATQDRVSRRTREYINVHRVPTFEIDYLGEEGMKVDGIPLPASVLEIEDTLFACIFIDRDSVGCRKIARWKPQ